MVIPFCTCQRVAEWRPGEPFTPCTVENAGFDCNHPRVVAEREAAKTTAQVREYALIAGTDSSTTSDLGDAVPNAWDPWLGR